MKGPLRRTGSWPLAATGGLLALCAGCGGHIVNLPPAPLFDFEHPPCAPADRPSALPAGKEAVEVRYLGAAGLYLRWGDDAILLGPYFSNPGVLRVGLGRWRTDRLAVERGLAGLPISAVEAIFAGHSHYDHIGDLPVILEMAPRATVYANRSGAHALAHYSTGRVNALEDDSGHWIWLERGSETRPIRFLAVPSEHAPQIDHHLWAARGVEDDWHEPWTAHRFHQLGAGQTFALVIDLMSSDRKQVRYRLYYQDAASSKGVGVPQLAMTGDHPYDLAVLCIASYDKVHAGPQPESILRDLTLADRKPRHVLVTHYDDFFRPQDRPVRFVALLTDAKVDHYLRAIDGALGDPAPGSAPIDPVCGPSGRRWTMPLPGAWMRFLPARVN
jgi:hypothetical protein